MPSGDDLPQVLQMADGLSDNERALAWLAAWHPSFEGIAIVNRDFTFRAVNHQFCQILTVTPAELVDNRFTEITTPDVRELAVQNAKLVVEGKIENFLMPKTYEFANGKKVAVTLLASGVYHPDTGDFMFFVAKIMARQKSTPSALQSRKPIGFVEWVDWKKLLWSVLTVIGLSLLAVVERLSKLWL